MKQKIPKGGSRFGNWFRAAAVAIPLLVGGGYCATRQGYLDSLPVIGYTETETDKVANGFPESFSEATNVRKYRNSGSRYLLVHIKTVHPISEQQFGQKQAIGRVLGKKEISIEDINRRATQVFDNVSGIVDRLAGCYSLDTVYMEGLTKGNDVLLNDMMDGMVKIDPDVGKTPDITRINKAASMELARMYPDVNFPELPNDFALIYYMGLKATLNGRLWASPAEKEGALNSGLHAHDMLVQSLQKKGYSSQDIDRAERLIESGREDALLSLLSEEPYSVFMVVYGAGHDWKDNIEGWNRQNKTKRFSLVEIYPKGLVE